MQRLPVSRPRASPLPATCGETPVTVAAVRVSTYDPGMASPASHLPPTAATVTERVLDGVAAEDAPRADIERELGEALTRAAAAPPAVITVMNPVTRPVTLQLAVLATDDQLDTMYAQEWGEFSLGADGELYLVYRRRDGNDYATRWTPATTLPASLLGTLSPALLALVTAPREDSDG